jgi:hypothetical protein
MGTTAFMSVPYSMNASNVDPTDELQSLSISGDTLFISSGNYIILPPPTLGCTNSTATNYNPLANTDDGSCYTVSIGDYFQGGIVFYLDGNGGGLIASPSNQSDAKWGCIGTSVAGADGTAIGTGAQNTIDILNGCNESGIAARICDDLVLADVFSLGGYSDWYLPSKDELNEMYLNIGQGNALGLGNVGAFSNGGNNYYYWSSTEYDVDYAWGLNLLSGAHSIKLKFYYKNVRAIRAF